MAQKSGSWLMIDRKSNETSTPGGGGLRRMSTAIKMTKYTIVAENRATTPITMLLM